MRAAVRSIDSRDVDANHCVSDDPETEAVWIRLVVGPANGPGEESLDFLVCTPAWLREAVLKDGPRFGRHHLIIDPLDLSIAMDVLRRSVEALEGADWPSLGAKLSRLGYWEFEDYCQ